MAPTGAWRAQRASLKLPTAAQPTAPRTRDVSVCVLAVLMDGSDLDDCDLCVTCYVQLSVVVDGTGRVGEKLNSQHAKDHGH